MSAEWVLVEWGFLTGALGLGDPVRMSGCVNAGGASSTDMYLLAQVPENYLLENIFSLYKH